MTSSNSSPPKPNVVTPHDDFVEVIWYGAQDAARVRASNAAVLEAAHTLQAKGKPVWVSLRIQDHPLAPNMGAFNEVLKVFGAVQIDRLVICGTLPSTIMSLASTVIRSFNKALEIAYYKNPEEALAWLRGSDPGVKIV